MKMLPIDPTNFEEKIRYCETVFDFKEDKKIDLAISEAKDLKRDYLL